MDVGVQAGGGYTNEDIVGRVPTGSFVAPEDVARAVAFLVDPEQSGSSTVAPSPQTAAGSPTGVGRACAAANRARKRRRGRRKYAAPS
jgi:hypothetical protein